MKKFFITTGIISLIGSWLFHHLFNYKITTVLYHLSVILAIHVIVLFCNVLIEPDTETSFGCIPA